MEPAKPLEVSELRPSIGWGNGVPSLWRGSRALVSHQRLLVNDDLAALEPNVAQNSVPNRAPLLIAARGCVRIDGDERVRVLRLGSSGSFEGEAGRGGRLRRGELVAELDGVRGAFGGRERDGEEGGGGPGSRGEWGSRETCRFEAGKRRPSDPSRGIRRAQVRRRTRRRLH